jgi:membrane protein DedA with SNARE-associated domain
VRLGIFRTVLVLAIASHLRHEIHGSPIDYLTLAAGCAASWVGLPGPGEPLLIAAGVLAAHHKLQIGTVIAVAFLSATAGAVAGWFIGLKAGRVVLSVRGPLWRHRLAVLRKGDEVFAQHPVLAIFLTPAPMAGIHRVRTEVYLLVTVLTAAGWAAGIALASYFVGPSVVDFVSDLGTATGIALGVLIALVVATEIRRRRRRRRRDARPSDHGSGPGLEPPSASPG